MLYNSPDNWPQNTQNVCHANNYIRRRSVDAIYQTKHWEKIEAVQTEDIRLLNGLLNYVR